MEKQSDYRTAYRFSGLLKKILAAFVLFSINSLYAREQPRLTYSIIRTLDVYTVNERNYCGEECGFELKIPYIKADEVMAAIPELPNGVSFVSLRRSEYSDETTGTKIEIWLNFQNPGKYKLNFLKLTINGMLYNIPFNPVEILENPKNMLPQLVVIFDNGTELVQTKKSRQSDKSCFSMMQGQKMNFTIYLQYAVQMLSYNWSIPKNALLEETDEYEITKGNLRNSEFSEAKIPVATFAWQPLISGSVTFPQIKITATAYNGSRVELSMPEAFVDVQPASIRIKNGFQNSENYFSYAFTSPRKQNKVQVKKSVSREECETIVSLREKERRSLPFDGSCEKRKTFEKKLEINDSEKEPLWFYFFLSLGLTLCSGVFLLFAGILKRTPVFLLVSTFGMCFFVVAIISLVSLKQKFGIFTGGGISPVPETSVESVESIESGKRVRIEQNAGGWMFIRVGSSGGWVPEENVIPIN